MVNVHRNTVYGHAEWKKHKSSWRHMRHVVKVFSSGVIAALGPPVAISTITAVFVTMLNFGVQTHRVAPWVPLIEVAIEPFMLLSPVLALLLVFRTNASYMRFDEARKAWGIHVNRCRDLARVSLAWVVSPDDREKRNCVLRLLKAYPYFLKFHLTEGGSVKELVGILSQEEIEAVCNAPHRPLYILQMLTEIIRACRLAELERVNMDNNMAQFLDNLGTCERLFKTPIPVAYTRLTSRVLMLWHLALPFGLWEDCRWLTIPATFMSAATLFYIEQVGVMIEEPFWVLSLEHLCSSVTSAIDGLSSAHEEALTMDWTCLVTRNPKRGLLTKYEPPVLNLDLSKSNAGRSHGVDLNVAFQRSPKPYTIPLP